MKTGIKSLQEAIQPHRQAILNHELYQTITGIEELRSFANFHIFAVWDFMSLLKALQNQLTCTSIPWKPVGSPKIRFLINEIVLGEECDIDENGERLSHFEMYLEAMKKLEANGYLFQTFFSEIQNTSSIQDSILNSNLPLNIQSFLKFTFEIIETQKPHVLAAVFTFGREDLIPDMFQKLVDDLNLIYGDKLAKFKYYLDRHIEIDGEHHSHLALKMVSDLCGDNAAFWEEAKFYSIEALKRRKMLWDEILNNIQSN